MAYVSSDNQSYTNNENFATLPITEIASVLTSIVDDYYLYVRNTGLLELWRRCHESYFKGFFTTGQAQTRGLAGELTKVNINHFRNMLLHVINMITAQRPSFDPRAANSDYKSMAQTELAKGLLDYYMRQKGLEAFLKDAAEFAMVYGEGFIVIDWDHSIGDDVALDDDEEKIVKAGDIVYYNAGPLDVIRDYNVKRYRDCEWTVVRSFKNKYDLATQFTEYADDIKKIVYTRDVDRDLYVQFRQQYLGDRIPVYTFYHKPSVSLPEGRMVQFLDAKIVLLDGPLIAGHYPVKRISPNEFNDSPFGYSSSFDMLELQDNYNSLGSSITTNQEMFGTQTVAIEKGGGFSSENFGPMKILEINKGGMPPIAIQLTKTAPEIFDYLDKVEMNMEKIAGINSVIRGMPQNSLESGSALALVQQTAIQFNSAYEQSYNRVIEECGDSIITLTKNYATTPRIALISGKSNKWYLKEYKGADISKIERVIVDRGNPLAKTTAGKIQIAQDLLKMGWIKTPEQYIMVLQSGRLEPIIEGEQAELMFIKDENEQLSNGVMMEAAWTDDHIVHIREHKCVMASVDARKDPELMNATLNHLDQHLALLRETDPQQLMLLGQQPLQPEMGGGIDPELLGNNTNNAAMEYPDQPVMPEPAQVPIG